MKDNKLENRLKRVEGQLSKLRKSIVEETDCADVIPQFLAVKGALTAAYEEYVKISLESCVNTDNKKMSRLINLLVRS